MPKEFATPEFYRTWKVGDNKIAWNHVDAVETELDSETKIEYHCPNCGHTFIVEMPD